MKKWTLAKGGVALAGLALFSSCIIAIWDTPEGGRSPFWGEFQETVALEPGSTVQLENSFGDIEIRGWERNEVEVIARGAGQGSSPSFFFYGWPRSAPRVDVSTVENVLTIKTLGREDREDQPIVHYIVSVPEKILLKDIRNGEGSVDIRDVYGEVSVVLEKGDLSVQNFSGSLRAMVEEGSIEAEVLDLRDEDDVSIVLGQGDIDLSLEPQAGAELEADAGEGTIESEFDLKAAAPLNRVSARIGEGRAHISLRTREGSIRLKKVVEDRR